MAVGGDMASAKVWGGALSGPLVRGQGCKAPLKLKAFYCLHVQVDRKFAPGDPPPCRFPAHFC